LKSHEKLYQTFRKFPPFWFIYVLCLFGHIILVNPFDLCFESWIIYLHIIFLSLIFT
jgi:hypothetical protein